MVCYSVTTAIKQAMKFKPTQKQLHAQHAANLGLFETEQEAQARQARAKLALQHEEAVTPVQPQKTLSELPIWHKIVREASGWHARQGFTLEQHMEANSASFGAEAGSLRKVVRCDINGECL